MSRQHGNRPRGDHAERWDDELAAYALDALEPDERASLQAHLESCEACRERLRWLLPAVDVLPATVPQKQPPTALKANLMAVVEREGVVEPGTGVAPGARPRRRVGALFGLSLRPALAGLAALLLVVIGITGYALRDSGSSGDESPTTYEAKAKGSKSQAHGVLLVDGDAGSLRVADLPATGRDHVYKVWIQDSDAAGEAIHPSSEFVVSESGVGEVAIPDGLENARRIMVTREPKGGSKAPTHRPVLLANMS